MTSLVVGYYSEARLIHLKRPNILYVAWGIYLYKVAGYPFSKLGVVIGWESQVRLGWEISPSVIGMGHLLSSYMGVLEKGEIPDSCYLMEQS